MEVIKDNRYSKYLKIFSPNKKEACISINCLRFKMSKFAHHFFGGGDHAYPAACKNSKPIFDNSKKKILHLTNLVEPDLVLWTYDMLYIFYKSL